MTADDRAKIVERSIRLVYLSLESHLPYTHGKNRIQSESRAFHKNCVKTYAEQIYLLSQLY